MSKVDTRWDIPIVSDTFIWKAHHTTRLPLSFALLGFACCPHLSHWLNNFNQQCFLWDVGGSHLCAFFTNEHGRCRCTFRSSIWCFQANAGRCVFARHCTLKILTALRMPWLIHKLPVISASYNTKCIIISKRKWFEPRSYILPWNLIVRLKGARRRNVEKDCRFNILSGSHLRSQLTVGNSVECSYDLVCIVIGRGKSNVIGSEDCEWWLVHRNQ